MDVRFTSPRNSVAFWSKLRRNFKTSCSLKPFLSDSGEVYNQTDDMLRMAADHHEKLFEEPVVYRSHPYNDSVVPNWDTANETTPR
ncbi:unnamed protein product [Didymodactylos carnosus]|uniref:Uncharacterized protein n=1 Tax=Didymodactylos carnosus TaxID=1234261 RepID=A0A814J716_9BILA|nr:unnamed protein product [Didymodactylos carnosus]CAF1032811.1 unnamed protein product [Didymodactylos carnosus]CAF3777859.1 unnamed protein product [Didymodactylos carnosus]CAF3803546.1 unnamed protein product [Didymodactylos carnosus]